MKLEPRKAEEEGSSDLSPQLNSLLKGAVRSWRLTKGARFEAARRHKKRGRLSQLSVLVLSLYVMLFTMITLVGNELIGGVGKQFLDIAVIVFSSGIIGFSFYEAAKKHEHRSESFLRSAKEIAEVQFEGELILATNGLNASKIMELQNKYEIAISRFEDNHSHLDHDLHSCQISRSEKLKQLSELEKELTASNSSSDDHRLKLLAVKQQKWSIRRNHWRLLKARVLTWLHIHIIFVISVLSPLILAGAYFTLFQILGFVTSLKIP